MRLKSFHADSLAAALALAREALGADAIIVATQEDEEPGRGARVTAAIEERDDPALSDWEAGDRDAALEAVMEVLERHGTPRALTDRLVQAAADSEELDVSLALAGALDRLYAFRPLPDAAGGKPLMLIGPPGAGKTVTCAKIAARLAVAYEERDEPPPVVLIGADPMRVAAMDQLKAYAARLGARFEAAPDAAALGEALGRCGRRDLVIIDTPGCNPYDLEELAHLVELAAAADVEPVLVLAAGRDAEEAADLATAFRPVEPTRLIATGLDIAHRLGALLAAAEAGRLAFCEASRSPRIAEGLKPLNPLSLARLLLPRDGGENASVFPRVTAPASAPDDPPAPRPRDEAAPPSPSDDTLPDGLREALEAARSRAFGDDDDTDEPDAPRPRFSRGDG